MLLQNVYFYLQNFIFGSQSVLLCLSANQEGFYNRLLSASVIQRVSYSQSRYLKNRKLCSNQKMVIQTNVISLLLSKPFQAIVCPTYTDGV